MPVANCFHSSEVKFKSLPMLVSSWAQLAGIEARHITFNTIEVSAQAGHPYALLVNLYLPALWKPEDVKVIQLSLLQALADNSGRAPAEIFIMTSLISTGNVVDDGTILEW